MTQAASPSGLRCGKWFRFPGLALALLGAGLRGWGADPVARPEFMLRSWASEDGLPAARIQAIAQTDDGYLWLATSRGLARFDGVRFVILTTNNTPELGDDRITCLLVSRTGDLWVGTEGGSLCRRRGGDFERVPLGEQARPLRINALVEDRDAVLWIGTHGQGLVRWCQGVAEWCRVGTNNLASDVTRVVADRNGRLWAIAGEKLAALQDGVWRLVDGNQPPMSSQVVELAAARDCGLWVATCAQQDLSGRGTQIYRLTEAGWTEPLAPYPWPQDTIFTRTSRMLEDRENRLWVATVGGGMLLWTGTPGWQPLVAEGTSSLAESSSLAEGKEGSIWVGTTDFQLFRIRSRPVTTLRLPERARQNIVLTACARSDGNVWVGTDGKGAFYYHEGQFTEVPLDPAPGNRQMHVAVLYEDRHNNLWAGTWAGLYRVNDGRFQRTPELSGMSNVVLTLREDRAGNLWAGTGDGVFRLGSKGVKHFGRQEGVDHFYIRAIEEDRAGQIWVAITDRGLYRQNGERFEHFGENRWAGEKTIRGLHADTNGALWITTSSKGLACYQDGKFREWNTSDGLPTDELVAVTEDEEGNLWLSSANGIFGCPKSWLFAYQRSVTPPLLFWQLSAAEGLEIRRCSGAGQPAVTRSADGRLWFPNWHALATFDPGQLRRAVAVPLRAPVIEETLVDGVPKALEPDGTLRSKSPARSFEIHYSSPTLQASERLRFRYQLDGWDADWVDAGPRRVAYFTHLPIGQYEFRVQVGGPGGDWQDARQNLRLEVVPRFWERRSVQALASAGALAAVVVTVWRVSRARMRRRLAVLERQQALEQERARIARDMHDEIGARLTQISLLTAMTAGSAGDESEVRTQTQKISGLARGLTQSLDEIVWAVRPQNDNLESLVDYLGESLRDLCEGSSVRYWFSGPPEVSAMEVPASVRHNILLACSEVVNNALKHSGASEVRVNVRLDARQLQIDISDNGHGFDVAQGEAKRSGLIHIRQRLDEIGGTCEFNSAPGQGTRFVLTMPIGLAAFAIGAGNGKPQ